MVLVVVILHGTGILGGISSFFNGLYDRLFKLDDDSIKEIYDNSVDLLSSGDSPIDFYNTIFDAAQSSSGDFVISWGNIDFDLFIGGQHITSRFINGDSINFNAIIRADNRLSDMWHTFQIILVFTVYYFIFIGWYDCIIKLLGVSDSLVSADDDDRSVTTFSTTESISSTTDLLTGEVSNSNKMRKTYSKRIVSRK